jgi:hypothetical protein
MDTRDTTLRAMHDLGAAAWFGGSLMGAIGLNGAASDANNPAERARLSADGWMRWAPVNAAAIGAHLIGGAGLLWANKSRHGTQAGVATNTAIKTALTVSALAASAYGAVLGARVAQRAEGVATDGATEPSATTPSDVASAQRQLKVLQWATPALTATIIALGSQQGEMQRPRAQVMQLVDRLAS